MNGPMTRRDLEPLADACRALLIAETWNRQTEEIPPQKPVRAALHQLAAALRDLAKKGGSHA